METGKIKSFTDLNAWKEGHKLVLSVYSLTKKFPKEEVFALSNQMRRCAVSVTSNIAEGFSRQTAKEKVQFYSIAQGSVTELQNQLIISRDVSFILQEEFSHVAALSVDVHKLISGLMKSAENRIRHT
jgi:four helix bundle protein